jgi:zinc and cadmium transporter
MRALAFNLLTGLGAVVGGLLGYFALGEAGGWLPYVVVVAASSFIYIALSDLIPQLHAQADSHHHGGQTRAVWQQPVLMLAGVALAALATRFLHGH